MIEASFPLPPSVNALYRNVPGKGRVKTHRYKTWLNAAGWCLVEQKPGKVRGDYSLWLYPQRPDRRRRDLGNLLKAVEDLLVAHGLVDDDSMAAEIHLCWQGTGSDCRVLLAPYAAEKARAA